MQSKEKQNRKLEEKLAKEADPLTRPVFCNPDGRVEKRPTILLIDKDPFLLSMYSMSFIKGGFNAYTLTTANGDLAQKVFDVKPDVITIEIVMSGRDAIQAIELLKRDDRIKNIPIIVLTNQDQQSDIKATKGVGIIGYIIKATTNPPKVVEEVKRLLWSYSLK